MKRFINHTIGFAIIALAAIATSQHSYRAVPAPLSDTVNLHSQRYTGTGDGVLTVAAFTASGSPGETITMTCTAAAPNAGTFTLKSSRRTLSDTSVTVAVAHSADGLAFTIADGAADFVVGDEFILDIFNSKFIITHTDDNLGDPIKITDSYGVDRTLVLPDGVHPIQARRIWSTGTSVDDVTVLY